MIFRDYVVCKRPTDKQQMSKLSYKCIVNVKILYSKHSDGFVHCELKSKDPIVGHQTSHSLTPFLFRFLECPLPTAGCSPGLASQQFLVITVPWESLSLTAVQGGDHRCLPSLASSSHFSPLTRCCSLCLSATLKTEEPRSAVRWPSAISPFLAWDGRAVKSCLRNADWWGRTPLYVGSAHGLFGGCSAAWVIVSATCLTVTLHLL